MTSEEYDRIRKSMGQGVDGAEESEQKRQAFEDSIFFIGSERKNKVNKE